MNEMVIHGDVEALLVDIIQNSTPELASFGPPRVSTDLRDYQEGERWVAISVEGGLHDAWNLIWNPRLDVEIRAETRSLAHDISQIVFASLFRAVPHSAWGETLSEVKTELGLTKVSDKEEVASYRYVFSLRLTCLVDPSYQPES